MIIYNLRTPVETDNNNSVGVTGENNSYTASFFIQELSDANLDFTIHLRFADGSVNTVVPDNVEVGSTGTSIIWKIKKNDIFCHGFFEMQIEGRKNNGYIFQTEIVRMYADESIPVEDKEYENPNSETLKLREEAYEYLCELKLQQDKLDENMKLLLETDITKKQDVSNLVNDIRYITDPKKNYPSISYLDGYYHDAEDIDAFLEEKADKSELKAELNKKQNAVYIYNVITNINDLLALNDTKTVYSGRIQGFSTKFGESTDNINKSFRMWFLWGEQAGSGYRRIIAFDDGTIWNADKASTIFTQISYSKSQVDNLLSDKADKAGTADKASTLAGYGIEDAYTKDDVNNLLSEKADKATTLEEYGITNAIKNENGSVQSGNIANGAVNTSKLNNKAVTMSKLGDDVAAEINGKFNLSDIEMGSGNFSTTSARISSANFEYQKIRDYVTVNIFVRFAESSMGATTSIQLTGLPFANKNSGVIRLPIATSAKKSLIAAVGSGATVNILTSAAVNFLSDETAGFTLLYKIN